MEGLKLELREKIGVQVMRNLHEAKNMALKAEFMLQDRRRYKPLRRNYNSENSRALVEKGVTIREPQPRYDRFREKKATDKQRVTEAKEAPKPVNPYARPTPIKCFKCNQMGHCSSDCPCRKVVHLANREDGDDNKVCYELYRYGDDDEVYEDNND